MLYPADIIASLIDFPAMRKVNKKSQISKNGLNFICEM
jgi:hypothetical protein